MAAAPLASVLHHLRSLATDELSDQQLLQRFAGTADEAAFATLVRRHGPLVLGVCRRVLGGGPDLDDVFQATFVILARKADSIRKQGAVGSWLYGVAYRLALELKTQIGRRRHRESGSPTLENLAETQPMHVDPSTRASLHELGTILDEELQRLPATSRDALVLCHLEGLSNSEAAQRLGWPLGTLKGRVQRAREALRQRLQRRGVTLSAMGLSVVLAEYTSAAVPATLLRATVRCASPNAVPARVAMLAEGAAHLAVAGQMKLALVAVLALGLLGLVASAPSFHAAGATPGPESAAAQAQLQPTPQGFDANDDPLPAGALARLGTLRWRHNAPVQLIVLSPDGKTVFSAADDRLVHVWDFATGKELCRFGPGKVDQSSRIAPPGGATNALPGNTTTSIVAVASDGKLVATCFSQAEVQLWDSTGAKVKTIPLGKGNGSVGALAFTPDSKHLAVAGTNGAIRFWDLQAEQFVRTMQSAPVKRDSDDPVKARLLQVQLRTQGPARGTMVFAPDGKTLAAVYRDLDDTNTVQLKFWDVQGGKERNSIKVQGRLSVASPVFSPDGKWFAYSRPGGDVAVLEAATGKLLREWRLPDVRNTAGLVFAADSAKLYTKEANGVLREWDVQSGKELRRLADEENTGLVTASGSKGCLALSGDGKTLAVGGDGATIRFVDLATGKALPAPGGHVVPLASVSFAGGGKVLITQSSDRDIRLWDAAGKQLKHLPMPAAARNFAASSDGRIVAVENERGTLSLLDAASGKELANLGGEPTDASFLFAPDCQTLAVRRFSERGIALVDVPSGKERCRVALHLEAITRKVPRDTGNTFYFAPDGRRLAVIGPPKTVTIYETATGQAVQTFELTPSRTVRGADLSADGRLFAYDSGNDLVHLIELATGKERCTVGKGPAPKAKQLGMTGGGGGGASTSLLGAPGTAALAFAPDSRTLAVAQGRILTVWDTATAQEVASFEGHQGTISTVAFAPDGRSVATGSGDTTALIWDASGLSAKTGSAPRPLDADAALARWADLASDQATVGLQAINALTADPKQAVPLLKQKLQPVPALAAGVIEKLIDDLGNGDFKVRQKAQTELAKIGDMALPQLEKALGDKLPLESRQRLEILHGKLVTLALTGERLQVARGIEVLERIATPEARAVLQALADGAPGALATMHARGALERGR
jgi:RNA polymerase sigma factor (sigma-70 family)